MTVTMSYGFVGLGLMGLPMAANLARSLDSGDRLYVFDVVQTAIDKLAEQFPTAVEKATSAREVAERSDIIFTMLPEGRHVQAVYIDGANSISKANLSGKLLIDCSTIDTETSLLVKQHLSTSYPCSNFYDAPVSGGVIGAEKGVIAFFLGASEDDPRLPLLRSLLSRMGSSVIPCGGPSLGITAKLCNNYVSGIITIAASEGFNLGMRAGLDPRVLYKVIGAGSAQNTICDKYCPVPHVDPNSPSSHGYRGGFRVPLMLKDLTLAKKLADLVGASTEIGDAGRKMYDAVAKEEGYSELDVRSMFRYIGGDEDWDQRKKP